MLLLLQQSLLLKLCLPLRSLLLSRDLLVPHVYGALDAIKPHSNLRYTLFAHLNSCDTVLQDFEARRVIWRRRQSLDVVDLLLQIVRAFG